MIIFAYFHECEAWLPQEFNLLTCTLHVKIIQMNYIYTLSEATALNKC